MGSTPPDSCRHLIKEKGEYVCCNFLQKLIDFEVQKIVLMRRTNFESKVLFLKNLGFNVVLEDKQLKSVQPCALRAKKKHVEIKFQSQKYDGTKFEPNP